MRIRFNPEVTIGNLISGCLMLIFLGGLILRISQLEALVERHTAEIQLLNQNLARVLVLLESKAKQ
jgi:hypothetical protein